MNLEGAYRVLVIGRNKYHKGQVFQAHGHDDVKTVHLGHLHVKKNKIRVLGFDGFDGLDAVRTLGDDFKIRFMRQECPNPLPRQRLIIHYHTPLRRLIETRIEPDLLRRLDPVDVLQEASAAAFKALTDQSRERERAATPHVRFDGPAGFYKWLETFALNELKNTFRPEFLNRVDSTVVFHALSKEHIRDIVDLMLREVDIQLSFKGVTLEVTDAAKEWLGEQGYDETFGARPLRRLIQNEVEDRLSEALLEGQFGPGDKVVIDRKDDGLSLESVSQPALT